MAESRCYLPAVPEDKPNSPKPEVDINTLNVPLPNEVPSGAIASVAVGSTNPSPDTTASTIVTNTATFTLTEDPPLPSPINVPLPPPENTPPHTVAPPEKKQEPVSSTQRAKKSDQVSFI